MRYFLGIDPGKQGSYSLINEHSEIIKIDKLPTVKLKKVEINVPELLSVFNEIETEYPHDVIACLETSSAMPGQGVTSMFSFGKTYGIILACLYASRIPFVEVHPRTWTKQMYTGINGTGKERAYIVARQMFPYWDPKYKYEKDWADSLLIAKYVQKNA